MSHDLFYNLVRYYWKTCDLFLPKIITRNISNNLFLWHSLAKINKVGEECLTEIFKKCISNIRRLINKAILQGITYHHIELERNNVPHHSSTMFSQKKLFFFSIIISLSFCQRRLKKDIVVLGPTDGETSCEPLRKQVN